MVLSVLIPVYNGQQFIARCLNSILNQKIPTNEYEIIVVNDGSTDSSATILADFQKRYGNIRIHTQSNIGLGKSRDVLFSMAKGKFVYHLDVDDYLAPNSLDKVLDVAISKNVDIIAFDSEEVGERQAPCSKNEVFEMGSIGIVTGEAFLCAKPYHRHEVWWHAINRQYAIKNGYSFGRYDTNEDIMYTLTTFLFAKRVAYLPIKIHRYYQSSNSITRNQNRDRNLEMIKNLLLVIEDFDHFQEQLAARFENMARVETYLKLRKNMLVQYFLLMMLKRRIGIVNIQFFVAQLECIGVYPFIAVSSNRKASLKSRLMNVMLNKKIGLRVLSNFYKIRS